MPLSLPTVLSHKRRQEALARAWRALQERRYFKLIAGASLTDAARVAQLSALYAMAGADCVDIAADPDVVTAVSQRYEQLAASGQTPPLLMLSLDVDGDPHFRKVVVDEAACITCGLCIPLCPSEALMLEEKPPAPRLRVEAPLCYGCGRCLPVCPTDAFAFEAVTQLPEVLQASLSQPWVGAVELHSDSLDMSALETLFSRCGSLFADKLVSLCFRWPQSPETHQAEAMVSRYLQMFWHCCQQAGVAHTMLQIDGRPMSGTSAAEASLPAITSARRVVALLERLNYPLERCPVTVSGGINRHTAAYLAQPENTLLAGAGLGTVARQAVWQELLTLSASNAEPLLFPGPLVREAQSLVQPFQRFGTIAD